MRHFLSCSCSLLLALFFVLLGLFAMLLPWFEKVRMLAIRMIQNESGVLALFGFAFFLMGVAFIGHAVANAGKKSFVIKLKEQKVTVNESLVRNYLREYWQEAYPHHEIPFRILFKRHRLFVQADFPSLSDEEQRTTLQKVERDLEEILHGVIGYRGDVDVSIQFAHEVS